MDQLLKEKIYGAFGLLLANKIADLQKRIADLQESAASETKSSAGDKFETARAMFHREQEQTNRQLATLLEQRLVFQKIDIAVTSGKIIPGSLALTNRGYFFISIALGKLQIDGEIIIAVSPQAPLGKALMGMSAGEKVTVNEMEYLVENIS